MKSNHRDELYTRSNEFMIIIALYTKYSIVTQ